MAQTLQGHIELLSKDETFARLPNQAKQQYLTEEVIPFYEPAFTGLSPNLQQGYLNEEIFPALMPQQGRSFLEDAFNTAFETGTFGLVDRPVATNEAAQFVGGMVGGAVPYGLAALLGVAVPATLPFTLPIAASLVGAQGIGTDIRDQLDAGRGMDELNLGRTAFRGVASAGGALAGGTLGTTLIRDALINAGFNVGEVAGVQALEGQAPDLGQIAKAGGMGVGGSATGRGLNALATIRSDAKAQKPIQPTQKQQNSMLEQAEPPQGQRYSDDGMTNRALAEVENASRLGNPDDVVRIAKAKRTALFESLLRLEAQKQQGTPKYEARRKALGALDQFIAKPDKKGFVANFRPHTKESSYVEAPKPAPQKPQR